MDITLRNLEREARELETWRRPVDG